MTALDVFVLLTLGGAALIGFTRGLVHELLSLGAWVAGIVALKFLHAPLTSRVEDVVGGHTAAMLLAFALLFFPAYIAVKLFARAVGNRSRKSMLGPIDRILGGGFGLLKGLLGATIFFLFANLGTDLVFGGDSRRPTWMTDSRSYPLLNASSKAVVNWVETRRHPGVRLENDQ